MLFNSAAKWWGDWTKRDTPHEGLDLCFFRDGTDSVLSLKTGSIIPVMHDGEVVRTVSDFLGETIFIRHKQYGTRQQDFYTIYGHVKPCPGIAKGMMISEGELLGSLVDTSRSLSGLPPHLHISVALISREITEDMLDWTATRDLRRVKLYDPLDFLDCRYALAGIDSSCSK